MVSWSTVQSLAIFFGPIVYSKATSFYRSTRIHSTPVPLPLPTKRLLDILFLTAVVALILSASFFSPENIFSLTKSRLQTPTDVLFNRLSKVRELTPADEALRSRLQSKDGRLLYAAYGPTPLAECNWCALEEPNTFLWYSLPSMLWPHLLHLVVLGVVTSSYFSRFGRMFRTQATIASVALFTAELWMTGVSSSGFRSNSIARSEADIQWTHWRMRVFRGVGMAVVDALLGYAIWLSATRRWRIGWDNMPVEHLQESFDRIEKAGAFLHAGNHLKQTILRDTELRGRYVEWWAREDRAGAELMGDDEVEEVTATRLPGRLNVEQLRNEAARKSEGLMTIITGLNKRASST